MSNTSLIDDPTSPVWLAVTLAIEHAQIPVRWTPSIRCPGHRSRARPARHSQSWRRWLQCDESPRCWQMWLQGLRQPIHRVDHSFLNVRPSVFATTETPEVKDVANSTRSLIVQTLPVQLPAESLIDDLTLRK